MSEFVVRRYRPDDRLAVCRLHKAAMRDAGSWVEGADDSDLDDVKGVYLDDGEFLVGETGSDIVAMGAFRPADGGIEELFDGLREPTAELKRMRVAPDYQRRGVGRRLYAELERRARDAGYRELILDTTPVQTAAQKFYESSGFERERSAAVVWNDTEITLVCYRKPLE